MSKRKSKRLFPRHMQAHYIPVSRIDTNKAAAYNAQRSRATTGVRGDTEHKLDSSFMEEIPETKTPHVKHWYSLNSEAQYDMQARDSDGKLVKKKKHDFSKQEHAALSERGRVILDKHELLVIDHQKEKKEFLHFYKVWQTSRRQGVLEYYCKILKQTVGYRFLMYFSGEEYLFVQEVEAKNIRRISTTYIGFARAMKMYRNSTIAWVLEEPLKP